MPGCFLGAVSTCLPPMFSRRTSVTPEGMDGGMDCAAKDGASLESTGATNSHQIDESQIVATLTTEAEADDVEPEAEWLALENFVSKAFKKLAELPKQLEEELKVDQIKSFALGKQGLEDLKDEFKEADRLINHAHTVAKAVKKDNSSKTLGDLVAVITKIKEKQDSIVRQADSPKFRLLRELAYVFAGLVGILWSLVMKMGILAATSPLVIWAPSIAGIVLIFIRTAHLIKVHIIDVKCTEDSRRLSNLYASLRPILKGIKKKMKVEYLASLKQSIDDRNARDAQERQERDEREQFLMREIKEMKTILQSSSPPILKSLNAITESSEQDKKGNGLLFNKLQELKELAQKTSHEEISKVVDEALALLGTPHKAPAEIV